MRVSVRVDVKTAQLVSGAALLQHAIEIAQLWGVGEWARTASRHLSGTYMMYVRGLADDKSMIAPHPVADGIAAAIVLVGVMPNKLEQGAGPWDIKAGLLRSPKVKRTMSSVGQMRTRTRKGKVSKPRSVLPKLRKGGLPYGSPYITVPFRHRTSGSGVSVGGQLMPADIKAIRPMRGGTLTASKMEKKLGAGGSEYGRRSKLPTGGMTAPYTWHSSPFASMVRTGEKRHTQYMTFRRVSLRSDSNSWWHPGFKALRLAREVAPKIEAQLAALVNTEVNRLMRGRS